MALLLVPDVVFRQDGCQGLVAVVCSQTPSVYNVSGHICFYSKQSRAGTAGILGLLLKAFWGLLRDKPDGVIYPLFAEWTRMECDVYGRGIPISHSLPGHLPRRVGQREQSHTSCMNIDNNNNNNKQISICILILLSDCFKSFQTND